jgi:tetratricopeptide (TPR) repeat protein
MNDNNNENSNEEDKMIVCYDEDGNERLISAKNWREQVLPDQLKINFDNPDNLYSLIIMSLQDGFYQDILEATEVLLKIDPDKERSYNARGILLMKLEDLDGAEQVLKKYINEFGATGVILTNLAKVYDEKNYTRKSEETLWEALKIDPNQGNGLDWWGAIHRDKTGEKGFYDAMRKAATIKGSWRPQLWLARECLEKKNLKEAKNYYSKILKIAGDDSDALMQISGDLGNNGYKDDIIELIYPNYVPEKHSPEVGFNILQCFLEKKDYFEGEKLLAKLHEIENPTINENLLYFSKEFENLKNES